MATAAEHTLVAALLEQVPDLVCFKDRDHRCIGASHSLVLRHRVEHPAELMGRSDEQFFSAEHAQRSREEENAVMTQGVAALKRTEQIRWPDGRTTWSRTSRLPLRNERGEIIGTIGLSEDCTAAKATERSLEEAEKELLGASRLAGMAEVATEVLQKVGDVLNRSNVSAAVLAAAWRQSKIEALARLTARLEAQAGDLEAFLGTDPAGRLLPDSLAALAEQLGQEQAALLGEVEILHRDIDHIKAIVAQQQSHVRLTLASGRGP